MISPVFAILTVISAVMVITSINPVHSIVWLVLSFIGSAMIFLQLQIDFIALATLIIYVGAIAILFIFVIMMLNLSLLDIDYNVALVLPLGIISVTTVTTLITGFNFSNYISNHNDILEIKNISTLQTIGTELYSDYAGFLILASIILLAGMIGAIVLTLDPSNNTKRQDNFIQISRDFHNFSKNTNNTNH
uniref:NADH dehydrogenase subunit 6 n=1 Tax=Catostylus townsendi TaxID=2053110 RepID=UPI001FA7D413|nr:NADH dehydrogenase subunit 6 [Catostylus townsendi]UNB15555.1 NADH dehydrogenase subunit 6 [Catostylus townsendi]